MKASNPKYQAEFDEGFNAKSIVDNPYWKKYPNPVTVDEECKARFFVDGWVEASKKK